MSEGDAGKAGESKETGQVAAGWYPDPQGSGSLFYWDGSKWTGEARAASTAPAAGKAEKFERPRIIVICGGVALAISPFLTWVKVVLLGNLSLFQLFTATGRSSAWAWVALLTGIAVAVTAFRRESPATIRAVGLGVGVVGGILAIATLESLLHQLRDANGLATAGIGPYVAVAGCIAMVVGGLMSKSPPTTLPKP